MTPVKAATAIGAGGRFSGPTRLVPTGSGRRPVVGAAWGGRPPGRTGYGVPVITAIVFVKADVSRIPEVAQAIAALEGVSEVYSVTGKIDLIALVRVRQHDDVAVVVADRLNKVDGVLETETHIAFRAYSRHDLESAFSLGLD